MAQPPTVEPPPAIPTPERSKEYYFWDGNRIFQVRTCDSIQPNLSVLKDILG